MKAKILDVLPQLITWRFLFSFLPALFILLARFWGLDSTPLHAQLSSAEQREFFERHVRPVLAENCYHCHGPKKQESGLRLDSGTGILEGGLSGPAVIVGNPEKSPLIKAIRHEGDIQMPPDEKLTAAQIEKLTRWIQAGAYWPQNESSATAQPGAAVVRSGGLTLADREFWSLQPVTRPRLPAVSDSQWPQTPVDRFILSSMSRESFEPAKKISRSKLIRRATYDLIGLPPTPEEIAAFLSDSSPHAFEKLIDRLLASPAHGERWGRHWLDVVRYCDSRDVRHTGQPYDVNEAWRYRDWVVNAVNRDMAYSDFITDQLAGDILAGSREDKASRARNIATGMLVIGEWGSGDADAKKMYTDIVDDQIHVVSQTFMGLSLTCARCHDHKFDPLLTRDYYAMAGIFFSTQIATPRTDAPLMRIAIPEPQDQARYDQHLAMIADLETQIQQQHKQTVGNLVTQSSDYLLAVGDYQIQESQKPGDKTKQQRTSVEQLCQDRSLNPVIFRAWSDFLKSPDSDAGTLLSNAVMAFAGNQQVFAWKGAENQPLFLVNTSDQDVSVPGNLRARSVAVHPPPEMAVAVAWKSPLTGRFSISGRISDAHTGGDGVVWTVERHGSPNGAILAQGSIPSSGSQPLDIGSYPTLADVSVDQGDTLRIVIWPGGDFVCDLTRIEFQITSLDGGGQVWNLEQDVVNDPYENGQGNPHSDAYRHADVWHFLHLANRKNGTPLKTAHRQNLRAWFAAVENVGQGRADRTVLQQAAEQIQATLNIAAKKVQPPDEVTRENHDPSQIDSLYAILTSPEGPLYKAVDAAPTGLGKEQRDALMAKLEEAKKQVPVLPQALVAREGGVPGTQYAGFQDAKIHIRGNYNRLGASVPRGFPKILSGDQQTPIATGSGRLELARWITHDQHPLTPRVMVNRIWLHHLGQGIVRTPGDFGIQGERPTHPELLDYLASRFVDQGGSWKAMHRMIMSSAAYQQSVHGTTESFEKDPENRWLSRANLRRLEVEAIRDTLYSVAGLLDRRMQGPSAPRYHETYSRSRRIPADYSSPRRALYVMTVRSEKSEGPFVLDAADPDLLVHQRMVSTTAPQALFLMNHPTTVQIAQALAQRIQYQESADLVVKLDALYRLLYGRPPGEGEISIAQQFFNPSSPEPVPAEKTGENEHDERWLKYCHALLCTNELIYVE